MAIAGADLLQENGGELARETFPSFDAASLDTQLDVWATAGNEYAVDGGLGSPQDDEAAFCWAYYLAYLSVFQRLIATPETTVLEGQGSVKIGASQASMFKKMADEKKDCAQALVNQEAPTSDNMIPPTLSVNVTSKWGVS